jgi:hypothetical protein
MKKLLIIPFLLFLIFSCDKNDVIDNLDYNVIGEWNWIRTDGGMAFHIHETPGAIGKSMQIKLTNDYGFTLTENDNVILNCTYELSLEKSIYSGELEKFIRLSEHYQNKNIVLNGIVAVISNDTLTISDNTYDGIGSTFIRKK